MLHVEVKLNRKYQIFVRSSMFLSRAIETLQHHNLPLLDSGISIHSISINEECWSVSTLQYYNIEIFGKIRHFVPKHSSVPYCTNFYESYSLFPLCCCILTAYLFRSLLLLAGPRMQIMSPGGFEYSNWVVSVPPAQHSHASWG